MRFIVTGCPRSGTRYAAALLQAAGVPCKHESTFGPKCSLIDCLRWYKQADLGVSSWLAWAFLGVMPGRVAVLHQLRDPWKVIDSLAHRNQIVRADVDKTDHGKTQEETIDAYCPRLRDYTSSIDRAAVMLLDWNERIKQAAADSPVYYRYRVEYLTAESFRRLLNVIGIFNPSDGKLTEALADVPNDCNPGRKMEYNSTISNPDVARAIAEMYPDHRMNVTRVSKATDTNTPEQLAGEMNPRLLAEVNRYATRHGYPTVEAAVVA